jgi:NAD-dependent deacetylase
VTPSPSARPARVLVITGAGVSAESGLPTYRGNDGLWRRRSPYELATLDAFEREPETVWEWYRERRAALGRAAPNPAHRALARLGRELPGTLLVTQNVDDLHERADFPHEALVHIHGEILVDRCTRCDRRSRTAPAPRRIAPTSPLPRCPHCEALLRPDVVWFGERLDHGTLERVETWMRKGPVDATLVVGTTATFPYIVDWALRGSRRGGRLYEVNPEETPISAAADERFTKPAAEAVPALVERLLAGH